MKLANSIINVVFLQQVALWCCWYQFLHLMNGCILSQLVILQIFALVICGIMLMRNLLTNTWIRITTYVKACYWQKDSLKIIIVGGGTLHLEQKNFFFQFSSSHHFHHSLIFCWHWIFTFGVIVPALLNIRKLRIELQTFSSSTMRTSGKLQKYNRNVRKSVPKYQIL